VGRSASKVGAPTYTHPLALCRGTQRAPKPGHFPGGLAPPVHPSIVAAQWDFVVAGDGRGYEYTDRSAGIFSPRPYMGICRGRAGGNA